MTKISDATTQTPLSTDLIGFARPGNTTAFKTTLQNVMRALPVFYASTASATVVTDYATAETYFQDVNGRLAEVGDFFVYQTAYFARLYFKYQHPSLPTTFVWGFFTLDGVYLSV